MQCLSKRKDEFFFIISQHLLTMYKFTFISIFIPTVCRIYAAFTFLTYFSTWNISWIPFIVYAVEWTLILSVVAVMCLLVFHRGGFDRSLLECRLKSEWGRLVRQFAFASCARSSVGILLGNQTSLRFDPAHISMVLDTQRLWRIGWNWGRKL